jgi:hypothetical protein
MGVGPVGRESAGDVLNMPAKSKAQQRLFRAAAHNAQFPKAQKIQETMTAKQIRDFANAIDPKPTRRGPR